MSDTALARLKQKYAKLQSKAQIQSDEIKRLNRALTALRDDLADIKAQRDRLAKERRAQGPTTQIQ